MMLARKRGVATLQLQLKSSNIYPKAYPSPEVLRDLGAHAEEAVMNHSETRLESPCTARSVQTPKSSRLQTPVSSRLGAGSPLCYGRWSNGVKILSNPFSDSAAVNSPLAVESVASVSAAADSPFVQMVKAIAAQQKQQQFAADVGTDRPAPPPKSPRAAWTLRLGQLRRKKTRFRGAKWSPVLAMGEYDLAEGCNADSRRQKVDKYGADDSTAVASLNPIVALTDAKNHHLHKGTGGYLSRTLASVFGLKRSRKRPPIRILNESSSSQWINM